jgi:hypothetical protein
MSDARTAPFTDAECAAFNAYQNTHMFHPYTCGNDSTHRLLVCTTDGMTCPDCGYHQTWMHRFTAEFDEGSIPR